MSLAQAQDDVYRFQTEVKELHLPATPVSVREIEWEIRELCWNLIEEETFKELKGHLLEPTGVSDMVCSAVLADDIADSIYVLLYLANVLGIDMEPVWNEVQRANMAKKGGLKRADGKQLKPPGWQPPDIEGIITKQMDV